MDQKEHPMRKRLLALATVFVMFACLAAMQPASAAYAEEASVDGTYNTLEHTVSWDYLYSDDYFLKPADQYNHNLARLSLGMALASFRDAEHPDAQDDYLVELFKDMGFSQIETKPYRSEPTAYSVAYGFATKDIGDTTVVACAVCSGNYSKEWASNLTVGDMVRAVGFSDSSAIVQEALADYVGRKAPKGKTKLWVVGFSRGGAIANITAADCIESGAYEDVYAYTFATPRTTRQPVAYPNIFNIIQKEDPVPKVPLADWGFERYGRDLFLVSPEADSDSAPIYAKASELYQDMVGSEMVTNSEINYQLRILVDYLLLLFPDSAAYTNGLQPLLVDIMTGEDVDESKDALQILLKALNRYNKNDPGVREELKGLLDYLETLVGVYYLQGGLEELPADKWDPEFGTTTLFNGHFPFEYLAMMFASDDPEVLFSDNTEYIRLMIFGTVDVAISDGDAVLKEVLSNGTQLVDGSPSQGSFPDVDCSEEKVVITLPADQSYTITVKSQSILPQTVSYTGLLFSAHTVRAQADNYYSYVMKKGDTAVIRTSTDGRAIEPQGSNYTDISGITGVLYSPTAAMRMENNSVVHLTLNGFVNRVLLLLVILLVQALASLVLMIVRKKKNRKRNAAVAFIWHGLVMFLFALLEVALWFFIPAIPLAKMIPGILAFITLIAYAVKGCREGRGNWKTFWIYAVVLAAYLAGESLLIGDFTPEKGMTLIAVYLIFLVAAFILLWRRKAVVRHAPKHAKMQ